AVNRLFEIEQDYDLRAFEKGQSLNKLLAKIFKRLSPILAEAEPDAVLVQGDTTTVAIAALASFNMQIPVIHLEAGLR
ncbi:UDP-N-acetylglucosamine 2-epimerase, partial [Actinotignum timonense]|uniref:UDP-N-acetylglucosamine 2-epimerase n=1 Tax=Actinotignum timonense TaxID=1870995 RepID=UPI00254ADB4A|nr:UDP-N-acetylglucosamine 2-epimerase [Actinotignum timonense]